MKKIKIISLAVLAFSLHSCRKDFNYIAPAAPPVTTVVHFSTEVYPLLITPTANCANSCHDPSTPSGLDFNTPTAAFSTLLSTNNVIPSNAAGSMFYISISTGLNPSGLMPQGVTTSVFTNSELELVKAWINQGALNN